MKSWEKALGTLKQTIEQTKDVVATSAQDLERELRVYDAQIEANERELSLLRKIDVELAKSSFDLDKVIKLIVEGALELTNAQYGDLLLPADSQHQRIAWSTRGPDLVGRLIPVEHSTAGRALLSREARNLGDVQLREPEYFEFANDVRSELAVPMIIEEGEVLGVINIASSRPNKFTPHHCKLVKTLAGQAVIAFRNARLYAELKAIMDSQSNLVSETNSLRNTLASIGERARELVGAEGCQVLRKEGDSLIIEYTTGSEPLGTRVLLADSISGLAALSGEPVNIADVRSDSTGQRLYKDVLGGMRSELAVPIAAKEKVLGVINVESPRVGDFKGREHLIRLFADQAAVAILNAMRVEELLATKQGRSELWAMAQIGDIAANLVHRLNSDVGMIKVLVDEIRYKCPEALEANRFLSERLDDIYKMALKALDMPHQLRARIERADQYGDVNVNNLVQETLEAVDRPAGVVVDIEGLDAHVPQISTLLQFDEVLKNLIQNAYDAMADGGTLKVETRAWTIPEPLATPESVLGVEIKISNTGPPIPEDRIDTIFEIGKSYKTHRQGWGFGLWWVKSFMDRVGGEVAVQSEPGKMTTFAVRMPLQSRRVDPLGN